MFTFRRLVLFGIKCIAIEWERRLHTFLKKKQKKNRGYDIISMRGHWRISFSIYIKPLYSEMSQGKLYGCSSSQAQQRVKHFKFDSEAKLFLKFSWQPASLVIHPFDVCFKNLAQTHKLWARNPNKQSEKPWTTHGKLSLYHHSGPNMFPSVHFCATVIVYLKNGTCSSTRP